MQEGSDLKEIRGTFETPVSWGLLWRSLIAFIFRFTVTHKNILIIPKEVRVVDKPVGITMEKINLVLSETSYADGFLGFSDAEWTGVKKFLPILGDRLAAINNGK